MRSSTPLPISPPHQTRSGCSLYCNIFSFVLHHCADEAQQYVKMFSDIERYPQLRNYYIGCHKVSMPARLAQSVEHETLNLRVVGSSPTSGDKVFFSSFLSFFCFVCSFVFVFVFAAFVVYYISPIVIFCDNHFVFLPTWMLPFLLSSSPLD